MYCQYCEEEQSARAKFCKVCGAHLVERPATKIQADLAKNKFLLDQVKRWTEMGKLTSALADELTAPHQKRVDVLEAALAIARGETPPPAAPETKKPAPVAEKTPEQVVDELTAPYLKPLEVPTATAAESTEFAPQKTAAQLVAALATPAERKPESPTEPAPEVRRRPRAPISFPETKPDPAQETGKLPWKQPPAEPTPPPSSKTEAVVAAVELGAAALGHGLIEPLDVPEPPPTPEQQIIEKESNWSKVLKPFLTASNIIFAISGFALVAGSFWSVAESRGDVQTLLISGLLATYATGFWIGGWQLKRKGLTTASRVLASISGAIAPMSILSLQPLKDTNFTGWVVASVFLVLAMTALIRACASIFGEKARESLAGCAFLMVGLFAFVPLLTDPLRLAAIDALALAALWLFAPSVGAVREDKGHTAFLGLGAIYLALCLFIRAHYQGFPNFGWVQYGPLVAMAAGVVLKAERSLFPDRKSPSWLALLAFVLILPFAIGCYINEVPGADGFEMHRPLVASGLTALIAAALLAMGGRAWRSKSFVAFAVIVGWVSFYSFSGFFRLEWLLAIVGGVKYVAGYNANDRLPYNYYLLPSLIYVLGLSAAYHFARKANADYATGALRLSGLIFAIILVVFGHLGTDFKPALFTCGIVSAGALLLSYRLAHWRLCYLSAATLVLTGLDAGLVARDGVAPVALGMGAAAILAVLLGVVLSTERARVFRDFAFLAAIFAWVITPFSGLGKTAIATWTTTAVACLAAAFAIGSGVPAAMGFMAGAGAVLIGGHELDWSTQTLAWVGFGMTFAMLAGSGLERRKPTAIVSTWFGAKLPLAAQGYDVVRGPMAFAALITVYASVFLALVSEQHLALALGAFALAHLYLARRQPTAVLLSIAILSATLAVNLAVCPIHDVRCLMLVVASAALFCAILAVLHSRIEPLRKLLRISDLHAGATIVGHACLFASIAAAAGLAFRIDGDLGRAPVAAALAAATFLVLARWKRWRGWLYPALSAMTLAVAVLVPGGWLAFVFACATLLPLALSLMCPRWPKTVELLTGCEGTPLPVHLAILAHLESAATIVAAIAIFSSSDIPHWMLSPAAGVLAVFWALAPRTDKNPIWLALSGVAAWACVALLLPYDVVALSLAAFSTILVAVGAIIAVRSLPSARVLGATGLVLALCALLAHQFEWPDPASTGYATTFALVALTLVLAPRIFGWAFFLPLAGTAAAAALTIQASLDGRSLALAILGIGYCGLALALRRVPSLAKILFGLDTHRGALWGLTGTGILATFFAIGFSAWLAADNLHCLLPVAGALGCCAGAMLLGFLAAEEPLLLAAAFVAFVAALACINVRAEWAYLLALAGVNVVFLLAGALGLDRGKRIADAVFDLFSPPGFTLGVPAPTRSALVWTGAALSIIGLALLVAFSIGRVVAFSLLFDPAFALPMVLAQLLTSLHQLRRRPKLDSWHCVLIAFIAGVWLLGAKDLWPYLGGATAIVFALLSWAAASSAGRGVVGFLAPGMTDEDVRWLGATLRGYSSLVAVLACAVTELDYKGIQAPVSLALAAVAFGIQAGLGAGSMTGFVAFVIAVPIAVHFAVLHVGYRLSTGRPWEAIMIGFAAAMAVTALVAERYGTWRKEHGKGGSGVFTGHIYAAIAAMWWIGGLSTVTYKTSDFILSCVAGAVLTVLWALRARASRSALPAWLAQIAFLTLYLSVRLQTDWMGPRGQRSENDALWALGLAVLFIGLNTLVKRMDLPAFRQPTRVAALVLPIASALLLTHEASGHNAAVLLGIAVVFTGMSAIEGRGKIAGLLAALAYNAAISLYWLHEGIGGIDNAQYFAIPAGFTLVILSAIFRDSLGPAWVPRFRLLGALAIYLSSALPSLMSIEHIRSLLFCLTLCIIGIACGIALRVRVYLYLAFTVFVTSVVTYLTRVGLDRPRIGAVFLSVFGLVGLGFGIYLSIRKDELLARYRKYRALLAEWE